MEQTLPAVGAPVEPTVMQHTPGPWVCLHQPARTEEIATVSWVGDWCVGVMTPGFPGGNYRDLDWGSPAADAKLIAAAPDLLAACLALKAAGPLGQREWNAAADMMDAAIAKAVAGAA